MNLIQYISDLLKRKSRKIQIRQGLSTDFDDTKLDIGEFGLLLDTNDVRIGLADGTTTSINNGGSGGSGNLQIADIPNATIAERGLMTTQQVVKLNGISSGANFTFVENVLNSVSEVNALSAAKGKEINENLLLLDGRVATLELNGSGNTITLNNTVTSTATNQAATANAVRIVNDSVESHKSKLASSTELGHIKVGNNIDIVPDGTISVKNASTVNKGVVQLVDDLVTNDSSKGATAKTVYELKQLLDNAIVSGGGNVTTVVNNLDSTSGTDALSAGMGNFIKKELDNKARQSDLDTLDTFVRDNVVTMGVPVTQNEKDEWNSKSNFNGDYDDLTNKPLIPTLNDTLTSTSTLEASTANQARVLKNNISSVENQLNNHATDLDAHISPTERTNWNNKADKTLASATNNGLLSNSQFIKLDGIQNGANFVEVEDSVTSTSATKASSSNAVKQAYDLAQEAKTLAQNNTGGGTGGGIDVDSIPDASTTQRGLMTTTQVTKLSTISSGANFVQVEDSLTSTSPTSALSAKQGNEISNQIGLLSLLQTTSKSNLVDAINEVKQVGNNVKQNTVDALLSVDDSLPITANSTWDEIITQIRNIKVDESGGEGGNPPIEPPTLPENYELATDNDFSGDVDGSFKYVGTKEYVVIPDVIKGVNVTSYYRMFETNVIIKGVASFNPNVINMREMFSTCTSLTSIELSNFNTSKVTDMGHMFRSCSSLTSIELSNFDTSKVTKMDRMFAGCSSLTSIDLSNFDTSKVSDIGYMFYNCTSLITAYARTQVDADKFNASSDKPTTFTFVVKP